MSLQVMPSGVAQLALLKRESDTLKGLCDELEENVEKLINQMQSLLVVRQAIDHELDALRAHGTAEQLEFNVVTDEVE